MKIVISNVTGIKADHALYALPEKLIGQSQHVLGIGNQIKLLPTKPIAKVIQGIPEQEIPLRHQSP